MWKPNEHAGSHDSSLTVILATHKEVGTSPSGFQGCDCSVCGFSFIFFIVVIMVVLGIKAGTLYSTTEQHPYPDVSAWS